MAGTLSESGGIGNEGLVLTNRKRFDKQREWLGGSERLTCPFAHD